MWFEQTQEQHDNRNPQGLSEYTACFNENKTDSLWTALATQRQPSHQHLALFIKFTFPWRKTTFLLSGHTKKLVLPSFAHSTTLTQGRAATRESWAHHPGVGLRFSAWEWTHLSVSGFTGAWHENIRMFCICFLSHPLNITIYVCDLWCTENVSIMYTYIPYKQAHIKLKVYVQIGFGVHNPEYLETTSPEDTVYKLWMVFTS